MFRVLVENGVKLSLTVIDTPGFGEAVDNTECWTPIVDYVEDQFDGYLEAETRVERWEGNNIMTLINLSSLLCLQV